MRSEEERLARRAAFNAIPQEYDAARPPYPPTLLADLVEMSGLGPGQDVLELGAGTGQLTLPLAETGASVLAVELGPDLAALLGAKVRDRPNVAVVSADFDTWDAAGRTFDHVMVASAFHWLDPATRLGRCHSFLRRGGSIGIVDVRWGVRTERSDDLFSKIQGCYERWDPTHDPTYWHPTPEQVPTRRDELRGSGLFENVRHRRYERHHRYTKRQFLSLIATYSTVRSWGADLRAGFLDCVATLFDERFPGGVTQTDLYDLTLARAAEPPSPPARGGP